MKTRTTRPRRARFLRTVLPLAAVLVALLTVASCGPRGAKPSQAPAMGMPGQNEPVEGDFQEIYETYHPGSTAGPVEREAAYRKFSGNLVTWSGPFRSARRTETGVEAEFVHLRDAQGKITARALVTFPPEAAKAIFDLAPGQHITYQGRVLRVQTDDAVVTVVLDEGKLLKVRQGD